MKKIMLCLFVVALWIAPAQADFIVKIEDLSNGDTRTFSNNTTDSARRNITETQIVGQQFSMDIRASSFNLFGISPDLASKTIFTNPKLGVQGNIQSIGGAVDLRISITDTDYIVPIREGRFFQARAFPAPSDSFFFDPIFNSPDSFQVDYYIGPSNTAFDTSGGSIVSYNIDDARPLVIIGSVPPAPIPTLGRSVSDLIDFGSNLSQSFSMTQIINVHLEPGHTLSLRTGSVILPEPSILFLIGLGLVGLIAVKQCR